MESIITIDGAARLVTPKAMRDRLCLEDGARILVREEDGVQLVLELVTESAVVAEVEGLLVAHGCLTGAIPDHCELRKARVRDLAQVRR